MKRDLQNAKIGGVCAGLAKTMGVPVLVMRLVFLVGLLWATLTFWVYLILWLVMPVGTQMHFLENLDKIRRQNGWFTGVCGGLAEYLGMNAFLLRVLWAFSIFWLGFGLIPYCVLWVCIPKKESS